MTYAADAAPPFYHGTRADLKPGDLIAPGYSSNYGRRKQASWVYLTGTLDAAVWGAELAAGGRARPDLRRRGACVRA
jgi:Rifampin ADP-ribosyl transferase